VSEYVAVSSQNAGQKYDRSFESVAQFTYEYSGAVTNKNLIEEESEWSSRGG
jgi:hypothetical protein